MPSKFSEPEEVESVLPPIYRGEQVLDLPEPDWLLEDFIQEGGLTIIHGTPGSGKSLIMQDWANVLAAPGTGWKWAGRVRTGDAKCLYIMGEGQGGLRGRLLAWKAERNMDFLPQVHWIMEPLDLRARENGAVAFSDKQKELIDYIQQEKINAVFIDTLAATFGAGNENMQQDMNLYLYVLRAMQNLGASVIVSHHDSKAGSEMRGSSVLKGAADTVIHMVPKFSEDTGLVNTRLVQSKQKDGIPFRAFTLIPKVFDVDTKMGQSVVLAYEGIANKGNTQEALLLYIKNNGGEGWRDIRSAVAGSYETLAAERDNLENAGEIEKIKSKWYAVSAKTQEVEEL